MSADKSKLHVLVLPEDRANHEIANGFRGHELNNDRSQRQIQVESVARAGYEHPRPTRKTMSLNCELLERVMLSS